MSTNAIQGVRKDFDVKQGNTWQHTGQWLDSTGAPIDLTTATSIICIITSDNKVGAIPILNFTKGTGITINGTGNSFLNIFIALPYKKQDILIYYYSVRATFPSGLVVDGMYGQHNVTLSNQ